MTFLVVFRPASVDAVSPDGSAWSQCGLDTGIPVIEGNGMAWTPDGFGPESPAVIDPDVAGKLAATWASAYRLAGTGLVAVPSLTAAMTSWGAIEPDEDMGYGRYRFESLDSVVEAFSGKVVLVLSASNQWDHEGNGPTDDRETFKEYVDAVVERYDGDSEFGVPEQDPSFPDIDHSGQVTPADWEASAGEKKAWAVEHLVAAFMVEKEVPDDPQGSGYVTVMEDVIEAAVAADPDVHVWPAPFGVNRFNGAKLQGLLGQFAGEDGPVKGLSAVFLTLPVSKGDPTGQSGMADFTTVLEWLDGGGFRPGDIDGVQVILGGIKAGYGPPVCESDQCNEQLQAESLVKTIALAVANGADAVALDGMIAVHEGPSGGNDVAVLDLTAEPPTLTPRPALMTALAASRSLKPGTTTSESPTLIPATRMVRSEPCEGIRTTVAWYDWTLEVSPGHPYRDLTKVVDVDADPDLSRTFSLAVESELNAVPLDGATEMVANLPAGDSQTSGGGSTSIILGRSPTLLVTREGGWPPVGSDAGADTADHAAIPDSGLSDTFSDGLGGNGDDCSTRSSSNNKARLPAWAALICLFALFLALRKRVER